jgi:hypothetical protein
MIYSFSIGYWFFPLPFGFATLPSRHKPRRQVVSPTTHYQLPNTLLRQLNGQLYFLQKNSCITNGDQKLDTQDAKIGYLSDLSGNNLQQITPNNSQILNWTLVQSAGAIFIKILKDSDNDQKFTEKDETNFIRVNLDKPVIGSEIISDEIEQKIKSLLVK